MRHAILRHEGPRRVGPGVFALLLTALAGGGCSVSTATEACDRVGTRICTSDGMSVLECRASATTPEALAWVMAETCAEGTCADGRCAEAGGADTTNGDVPGGRDVPVFHDFSAPGLPCDSAGARECGRDGASVRECRPVDGALLWSDAEACASGSCRRGECDVGVLVARGGVGRAGGFVHARVGATPAAAAGHGPPPLHSRGLALLIPPGALPDATEVRIYELPATARSSAVVPGSAFRRWRVELPEGVEIAVPAIARLPVGDLFQGERCADARERLRVFLRGDDGGVTPLDVKQFACAEGWVDVELPHFSQIEVNDLLCYLRQSAWTNPVSNARCGVGVLLDGPWQSRAQSTIDIARDLYAHVNFLLDLGPELDGAELERALDTAIGVAVPDVDSPSEVRTYVAAVLTNFLVWNVLHGTGPYADASLIDRYALAVEVLDASPSWSDDAREFTDLLNGDIGTLVGLLPGGEVLGPILPILKQYFNALATVCDFVEDVGWAAQFSAYQACRPVEIAYEDGSAQFACEGSCADSGPCCLGDASDFLCGHPRPAISQMFGYTFRDGEVQTLAELLYQIDDMSEAQVQRLLGSARELLARASGAPWDSTVGDMVCAGLSAEVVPCTTESGAPGRRACLVDDLWSGAPCDDYPSLDVTVVQDPYAVAARVRLEIRTEDLGSGLYALGVDWGDGAAGAGITETVVLRGDARWDSDTRFQYVYAWPGEFAITVTAADQNGNRTTRTRTVQVAETTRVCAADTDCPAGSFRCDCLSHRCWAVPAGMAWESNCHAGGGCATHADCGGSGWWCNEGACEERVPRGTACAAGAAAEERCDNGVDDDCDGAVDEWDCAGACGSDGDCPAGEACVCSSGACFQQWVVDAVGGGGCGAPSSNPCFDRECGSDGSGGTCGSCPAGAVCTSQGKCNRPPNAVLRFDRMSATVAAGARARFYYDVSGSSDPDGDPLHIVEFTFNGGAVGPQSAGWIELGPGEHAVVATISDGYRASDSAPVVLTISEQSCQPQCEGRECGTDRCGGRCGVCQGSTYCDTDKGKCVPGECGAVPRIGCCDGAVRRWCHLGEHLLGADCSAPGFGATTCGWDEERQVYWCGGEGEDPSGEYPRECSACARDCDGRDCGDDGCGRSCGDCTSGERCGVGGRCEPDGECVPAREWMARDLALASLAASASHVYFADGLTGVLGAIPACGGPIETIATGLPLPCDLVLHGDSLYVMNCASSDLERLGDIRAYSISNGSSHVVVGPDYFHSEAQPASDTTDIAVLETTLYFSTQWGIYSVPTAGGTPMVLYYSEGAGIFSLAVDDDFIYWSETMGTLRRVPRDGGAIVTLATDLDGPSWLVVDDSAIYVVAEPGGRCNVPEAIKLSRVPKNGGVVQVLATAKSCSFLDLAVDRGFVYFADRLDRAVRRVPSTGGTVEDISTFEPGVPSRLVINATHVYWALTDDWNTGDVVEDTGIAGAPKAP